MNPGLAQLLRAWREQTPYPCDDQYVFASPFTNGERPYWPDIALKRHVHPAVVKAGISKRVGFHTFRHSLAKILNDGHENLKTIQELLRHASGKITSDLYLQGDSEAKRAALSRVSSLFVLPAQAAS